MQPQEPPPAELPPAYPLDEALEHGYAPEPPEYIPGQPPAEQQPAQTIGEDAQGEQTQASQVIGCTSISPDHAPACARPLRDLPPQSVEQRLSSLPRWQASYVLALMETGGVIGMAALKCRVSRQSVEEHMKASPDFASACAEAVAHSTDLVEAAVIRGATIGDLSPVYQGGRLVGYKRTRNTKDAELALTIRGRMPDQQVQHTHTGRVEVVPDSALPAMLADIARALFPGPKQIEGKVVSEPDTK